MPHDPYKALYIHIPFCKSRCLYCDFHTKAVKEDSKRIDHYFEWLVQEVRNFGKEGELSEIETVYIGGGTPTFAKSRHLSQLLYALGTSMHLTNDVECSVEGNPESINENLIKDIWALGANRMSIGVQSFDESLLKAIGRVHDSEQAKNAIRCAQERFENVSIDLMCGLPGQTMEQFLESLEQAMLLGIKHLSIYPLTIERGTAFDKQMRKGRLHIPDEDLQADMMEAASDFLLSCGMKRYEVANYAFEGFESRHNKSYWSGKPYLGLGDSAVTMTQNSERRMRIQDGVVVDDLDPVQISSEDLMLAMRMSEGVSDKMLEESMDLLPDAAKVFQELSDEGFVDHIDGRWVPTDRGWMLGNELYGRILDLSSQD